MPAPRPKPKLTTDRLPEDFATRADKILLCPGIFARCANSLALANARVRGRRCVTEIGADFSALAATSIERGVCKGWHCRFGPSFRIAGDWVAAFESGGRDGVSAPRPWLSAISLVGALTPAARRLLPDLEPNSLREAKWARWVWLRLCRDRAKWSGLGANPMSPDGCDCEVFA